MADEEKTNWDYKPTSDSSGSTESSAPIQENLAWTANEFIEHERNASWYFMLFAGIVILALVTFLITKDYFAVGIIAAAGIIAAVYAGHKPREQSYELSSSGIKVGEKMFNYGLFKSFSVAHEGGHTSINLEPIKRLMPPMTIYFPPENEKNVTEAIGNHLPLEEHNATLTDRLAHRFRF